MTAEHLYTWDDPPNQQHLDQVVQLLRLDGVIALSTGTSWAFAADPSSKKATDRLRQLKPDHAADRPFSLLCASISMASSMASIDGGAYRIVSRLWPGPYTVLLPAGRGLPRVLQTKRSLVGVRVPDARLCTVVAEQFGGPLVVTTIPANDEGAVPTMGFEVVERFEHRVDLVLDLGDPVPGSPTTVLDMSGDGIEVIREGIGPVDF